MMETTASTEDAVMETIRLQVYVEADGMLHAQLPAELADQELEILIVAQPTVPRKRVWPTAYFEGMVGPPADVSGERSAQETYENRRTFKA